MIFFYSFYKFRLFFRMINIQLINIRHRKQRIISQSIFLQEVLEFTILSACSFNYLIYIIIVQYVQF